MANTRRRSNNRSWSNNDSWSNRSNRRKKSSGSRMGVTKNGARWVSGWNFQKRRGLLSFIATITSDEVESKRGRNYLKAVVNLEYKDSGITKVTSGFWNENDRKLYIPDLSMVASVSRNYFGSVKVKN